MNGADILDELRKVLHEVMGVKHPIEPSTRILSDLELDSLQRIELVIEVENRFRIWLEPEDEENLGTIGDLIRVIENRSATSDA